MSVSLAYIGVIIFVLIAILGTVIGRRLKLVTTLDHFLYSSREGMPWPVIASAFFALWIYGGSLMGISEGTFYFGGTGFWVYSGYAFGTIMLWVVFRKWKDRGAFRYLLSLSHYIRTRFDMKTWYLGIGHHVIMIFAVTVYCVTGVMFVLHGLTGGAIPYWVGGVFVAVFTAVYLFTGGLYYSFLLSFATAVVASIIVVWADISFVNNLGAMGGMSFLFEAVNKTEAASPGFSGFWQQLALMIYAPTAITYSFMSIGIDSAYYQPSIAVRRQDFAKAAWVGQMFVIVVLWAAASLGFAGRALVEAGAIPAPATGSEIYPHMLSLFAPAGAGVLFIIVTLLAGSTTIAMSLSALGAIMGRDVYGSTHPGVSEKQIGRVVKISMAAMLVITLVFSIVVQPSLLTMVIYMTVFGPSLGLLVLLSARVSWLNRHLVFTSGLIGIIVLHVLWFGRGWDPGIAALTSVIPAIVIGIIGSAIWRGKFDLEQLPQLLRATMKGGTK